MAWHGILIAVNQIICSVPALITLFANGNECLEGKVGYSMNITLFVTMIGILD